MKRGRLKRSKGLARTGMKRQPPPPVEVPPNTEGAQAWKATARRRPCATCGRTRRQCVVRGHHVIPQQKLEALLDAVTYEWWARWDIRNMLPLCDECHERHHGASTRVLAAVLPTWVWDFAREVDARASARRGTVIEPAARYVEENYPDPRFKR